MKLNMAVFFHYRLIRPACCKQVIRLIKITCSTKSLVYREGGGLKLSFKIDFYLNNTIVLQALYE
jgi:hypothetical protein